MGLRKAVYAGSFDPLTNGHLWVIEQGSRLFGELIVAVGHNPEKSYTFTQVARFLLVKDVCAKMRNVRVALMGEQFLVDFARSQKADWLLRGVRSDSDYGYEVNMLDQNKRKAPDIGTIFLTPPPELRRVSSSFVKSLVGPEGWEEWVRDHLPEAVYAEFVMRFRK